MAELIMVACPKCGARYQVPSEQMGQVLQCSQCQTPFPARAMAGAGVPMATPFNPALDYTAGGYAPKTSGMAIASLVCGIVICIPFASLLAIIFGIIGITQTGPGKQKGRGMAIAGTVLGGAYFVLILPLMISILLPSLNKAREVANRAKCASNMHQIGLAMLLYQNDNSQQYPPDLTTLLKAESAQISSSAFVCPGSKDTPAANPSQLEAGGHLSYQYIYPGPTNTNPSAIDVVLYENASDHANNGTNILFGDGHAEWFNTATAKQYIDATLAHTPK